MTKLSEYWSDGAYLSEGWHVVTIKDVRMFDCNGGSNGVEYTVANDAGASCKASFILNKPGQTDGKRAGMLGMLAGFVRACGITQEQAKGFDTDSPASHRKMIGKRLKVLSVKGEKYHDIEDWASADAETTDPVPFDRTEHEAALAAQAPADDDIPF